MGLQQRQTSVKAIVCKLYIITSDSKKVKKCPGDTCSGDHRGVTGPWLFAIVRIESIQSSLASPLAFKLLHQLRIYSPAHHRYLWSAHMHE